MGAFTTAGKNTMLDAFGITYAALFNGDPSGAGTEITGGSPAYARKSVTFSSAANGAKAASNQPVFDVPNGATVNYVAFYDASSGGTLLAYDDVTTEVFGAQGTYTLTSESFSLT